MQCQCPVRTPSTIVARPVVQCDKINSTPLKRDCLPRGGHDVGHERPWELDLMWQRIAARFVDSPQRLRVARALIAHGFHVAGPGDVRCKSVRIPLKAVGDALGVDRRTVRATTEDICQDPELFEFFSRLRPAGPSLEEVSRVIGYGVVSIYVEAPEDPGILAKVTGAIADHDIPIRQVLAEDATVYEEPCLKVITEEPLGGDVIAAIAAVQGVRRVVIQK